MYVLGADLSYTATGLVWLCSKPICVVEHMLIKLPPGAERLRRAGVAFHRALEMYEADKAVIEGSAYMFKSNKVTERMLNELRGVMKVCLEARHIPYSEPSPAQIRKMLTGDGKASKEKVAETLRARWKIEFADEANRGFNLTDAAACAVYEVLRNE